MTSHSTPPYHRTTLQIAMLRGVAMLEGGNTGMVVSLIWVPVLLTWIQIHVINVDSQVGGNGFHFIEMKTISMK
jgi:hypothetical protein